MVQFIFPRRRGNGIQVLLYSILLLCFVFNWYSFELDGAFLHLKDTAAEISNFNHYSTKIASVSDYSDHETKKILLLTKYWNQADFQFGIGRRPFLDYQCPINNCLTQSIYAPAVKNFSEFDAVLVSVQVHDHFRLSDVASEIHTWRQPHQRFVFFMMESQAFSIHDLHDMNGFFNWTMTFRWDSDIPRPYGWFEQIQSELSSSDRKLHYPSKPAHWISYDAKSFEQSLPSRPESFHELAKRPGKVAWIVSHCETDSRREDYVYELRKYIQVDQFGGKCLDRTSPACDVPYSVSEKDNCTQHVQNEYKFYLAFENQFCNDYVTEKFFQRMEHSVVITLGQANYSAIAPPHSSISIFDFKSAKDLGTYLHELDQDDTKYLSYFWWQDYYRVRHPRSSFGLGNGFGPAMCHLCAKLNDPMEPTKEYTDIVDWWRGSAECGKVFHGFQARMARDAQSSTIRTNGAARSKSLQMFANHRGGITNSLKT